MKISLNEMVSLLSSMAGQPFSVPLQEQFKVVCNYKRSDYFQQVIQKYPEQRKLFLKYFTVELEAVDEIECLEDSDCTVLRTIKKIPKPIRSTYAMYDFVGTSDRQSGFTYITPDQLMWLNKGSKYTKDRPRWSYINEYVYIYNDDSIEQIAIGGIFPDQRQLHELKCGDEICYTDDDQYDIPDDILNTMIQDILKNELRLLLAPEEGEVTVTEQNKQ